MSDGSVISASAQGARGIASCRTCLWVGRFHEAVVTVYGGAVVMVTCRDCFDKGTEILMRRGPKGVEILAQGDGRTVTLDSVNGGTGPILVKP